MIKGIHTFGELKVLFAILDWGLGHATRSTPIISFLQEQGAEIIIASRGLSGMYLKRNFPELHQLTFPDSDVTYSSMGATPSILARGLAQPTINQKQKEWTEMAVEQYGITHIISDNVYGIYSSKVRSILITHQLQLQTKLLQNQVNKRLAKWIDRFDEVWVPDVEGEHALTGELTKNIYLKTPVKHIGILTALENVDGGNMEFEFIAMLSGPEPLRSDLEIKLEKHLSKLGGNHALVRGTNKAKTTPIRDNITYFDLVQNGELSRLIAQSNAVICRSGYSSIMDLIALRKPAILIPTPGQPEQAYLSQRCAHRKWFTASEQKRPITKEPIFGHTGANPYDFKEKILKALF